MIDYINVYKKKMAWLNSIQDPHDNTNYRVFNDHRHAIVTSSYPNDLFVEIISERMEYQYFKEDCILSIMKK